jgi:hypothetical protein
VTAVIALFASTPTPATSPWTSNATAKLSAMMSVNAPGAVWCNTWHGAFIAMEDF